MKEALKKSLQEFTDERGQQDLQERLLRQAAATLDYTPGFEEVEKAIDAQMENLEAQLSRQGLSTDMYCNFMNTTKEALREDARHDAEAEALVADMQATFADVAAKSEKSDKTIYFEVMPLEWGLWSAGTGTFMHELAEICGMKNAFADIEGWQAVSQEQVIERDPDYIVLVTGMGEAAPDEVKARDGWAEMKAIKNNAIFNADSYAMTRPAPRLAEAVVDLYNFLNGIAE
jgi:iron complex transport system substrate-binding protein